MFSTSSWGHHRTVKVLCPSGFPVKQGPPYFLNMNKTNFLLILTVAYATLVDHLLNFRSGQFEIEIEKFSQNDLYKTLVHMWRPLMIHCSILDNFEVLSRRLSAILDHLSMERISSIEWTPTYISGVPESGAFVALLLSKGAQFTYEDLDDAISYLNTSFLKALIYDAKVKITDQSPNLIPRAMNIVDAGGDTSVLTWLKDAGADLDFPMKKIGYSTLMYALERRYSRIAVALMAAGANVKYIVGQEFVYRGLTPWHVRRGALLNTYGGWPLVHRFPSIQHFILFNVVYQLDIRLPSDVVGYIIRMILRKLEEY